VLLYREVVFCALFGAARTDRRTEGRTDRWPRPVMRPIGTAAIITDCGGRILNMVNIWCSYNKNLANCFLL